MQEPLPFSSNPVTFERFSVQGIVYYSNQDILSQTSLYDCDLETARELSPSLESGEESLVGRFINSMFQSSPYLLHTNLYPHVDVRTQRLMPGMFPSIPGWHLDAVPRPNGQPDLTSIDNNSCHYFAVFNTAKGSCNTQFIVNEELHLLEWEQPETQVYRSLHAHIENRARKLNTATALDGVIYRFTSRTPHRAVAATEHTVRTFIRVSWLPWPAKGNCINNQTQVYLLSEENGW